MKFKFMFVGLEMYGNAISFDKTKSEILNSNMDNIE